MDRRPKILRCPEFGLTLVSGFSVFPNAAEKGKNRVVEGANYIDEINVARCLDGFVLVVNKVGQLLYVSAGVSASIGFTQVSVRADMTGEYSRILRSHLIMGGFYNALSLFVIRMQSTDTAFLIVRSASVSGCPKENIEVNMPMWLKACFVSDRPIRKIFPRLRAQR